MQGRRICVLDLSGGFHMQIKLISCSLCQLIFFLLFLCQKQSMASCTDVQFCSLYSTTLSPFCTYQLILEIYFFLIKTQYFLFNTQYFLNYQANKTIKEVSFAILIMYSGELASANKLQKWLVQLDQNLSEFSPHAWGRFFFSLKRIVLLRRMEKVGLDQQKENICPYPPSFRPLPFAQAGPVDSLISSGSYVGELQGRLLMGKERAGKKISVLSFLQERRGRNQLQFGGQKKQKLLIK